METCFCWNLLELWDFLRQRRAVGVQAAVSHQQEATQPAVPCVSPLQAVLTGHVKTPLQTKAHGKHQPCTLKKSPDMFQAAAAVMQPVCSRAERFISDLKKTQRIQFGPKHSMLCAVKADHYFYR